MCCVLAGEVGLLTDQHAPVLQRFGHVCHLNGVAISQICNGAGHTQRTVCAAT